MRTTENVALTFDDVLIKPQFSSVESRSNVNVDGLLISANMKDITGKEMCAAMSSLNQIGCLHRFMDIEENISLFKQLLDNNVEPWLSVGFETQRVEAIAAVKKDAVIVVDVAHGYSQKMLDFLLWTQDRFKDLRIVAGNFAEFPSRILNYVDIKPLYGIKIGIGPGSVCTTRSVTGHGYPQLQAIINTVEEHKLRKHYKHQDMLIVADGGCKSSGDIAKALAAGAHKVMVGGLLAFTDACNNSGRYAGSASWTSYMENGKFSNFRTPEGTEEYYEGAPATTVNRVQDLLSGLRSAFSYSNSVNLKEFHKKAELIRVSNQTTLENSTRKWK